MIEHTDNPLIFNTAVNKVKYANAGENVQHCPFCDVKNLSGILRTDGNKIWLKNKFSTIEKSLMTVIIESDEHLGDISTYSLAENRDVFRFAFDCWDELISSGDYRSVLMFKNFGPHSGGTLRHPHLQVVGLEETDGYAHISPENFEGVEIKKNGINVTLSTKPMMGFVEFNVIIDDLKKVNELADAVHSTTHYLLNDYMNGRCDSYNLFFYHVNERYICKVVPRFITSPYFIGYKLPQVNRLETLEQIAADLRELL
ncbi:DUF4931 domain-containing protein [Lactococcus nasutitermitis]|uniref:DUF4931 domain-containing protein n=1 Tax=Lactococcus nasutitermitis TaxID=1652957 RepID=A0ABV9JES9_9LACT|nr:DUF4931 domain-containing protein [Lactococcus nasutitermitis]